MGWIQRKKENWPSGSLERFLVLNFPGCKNVVDAFKQAVKDRTELKELKKQLAEATGGPDEASNKDPSRNQE